MGQDQVSGGVSILCWLAAPVAMFYGNLQNSVIRSKSVLKSSSVINSQIGVMFDQLRVSLSVWQTKQYHYVDNSIVIFIYKRRSLDILTIYSPLKTLHLLNIFLIYIQENFSWIKQILPTKTSFLDLNIKVIDNNIHTSVYDKRDDFGFPILTLQFEMNIAEFWRTFRKGLSKLKLNIKTWFL